MTYEMRRTQQELSEKEIARILETASNATLALAPQNDDDFPYAVPISFAFDKASQVIYFH